MTELLEGSVLRRDIRIPSLNSNIITEISTKGIHFHVKGSRKKIYLSWDRAINAAVTPTSVPSFLMDKPMELLQHQANNNK